jgi:BMFP domain-containing protein YqiC
MNSSEKILKLISNFVETGILTSQDAKKEFINNLKFKRDDLIDKLQLVSREEYNILKKIIEKQQKQINQLKILTCNPLYLLSLSSILPP